jgi:hypothetical protein
MYYGLAVLPKLRIGLSPIWGGGFLLIAVLDLWLYATTGSTLQLGVAVIMGIVGVSHLLGALLVVDGNTIELKNPLGMTLKTFTIESANDLRIEGKRLWIKVDDREKKISGLMANGADWTKLRDAIAKAKAPSP